MALEIGKSSAYISSGQDEWRAKKNEVTQEEGTPNRFEQKNDVEIQGNTTENKAKIDSKTGKEVDPIKEIKESGEVAQLVQAQSKVVAHERAHMGAGGEFAGSATYSYTTGPDGKRYITGGEVSIRTPAIKEPEEKIRVMARVRAAALAPVDPSPQDLRVASSASSKESAARVELARKKAEEAYGNTSKNKVQKANNTDKEKSGEILAIKGDAGKGQFLNMSI